VPKFGLLVWKNTIWQPRSQSVLCRMLTGYWLRIFKRTDIFLSINLSPSCRALLEILLTAMLEDLTSKCEFGFKTVGALIRPKKCFLFLIKCFRIFDNSDHAQMNETFIARKKRLKPQWSIFVITQVCEIFCTVVNFTSSVRSEILCFG
jgi:hypothetical protein